MPINSIPTKTTPRASHSCPSSGPCGACASVPPPNFTNSPLIDRVIHDGKMYLSLDDAVALALENNLDIAIQRYNLITADVDILRTSSGAAALGVNTGLVQGTPGGTTGAQHGGTGTAATGSTGGGAGGTTIGVGGAARARPASSPPPRAKARRSTTSIPSLRAPVRNSTRSRRPRIIFAGSHVAESGHDDRQLPLHAGLRHRHSDVGRL